jgi:hypothetical protein
VDYAVNRKYFITRRLSPVKYGKKFVNGNIGPWAQFYQQKFSGPSPGVDFIKQFAPYA